MLKHINLAIIFDFPQRKRGFAMHVVDALRNSQRDPQILGDVFADAISAIPGSIVQNPKNVKSIPR